MLNLPHSIAPANTQSRVYMTRHWKRSVHYEEQAYKQTNRFPVVAYTPSIPAFYQLLALPDPLFVGLFILASLHSIVHAYLWLRVHVRPSRESSVHYKEQGQMESLDT